MNGVSFPALSIVLILNLMPQCINSLLVFGGDEIFKHFVFNFYCIYLEREFIYGNTCYHVHVEVREQLLGICSILLLCRTQKSNSVDRLSRKCLYQLTHLPIPTHLIEEINSIPRSL